MITYCSKCGINWASLWDSETDGDETVEFCPECSTDAFLQPGTDIVAFIKSPFTGKITNAETGEEYTKLPVLPQRQRKVKVFEETYEEFKQRQEAAEDEYLEKYINLCATMPSHEAIKAAGTRPVIERKHHFETIN